MALTIPEVLGIFALFLTTLGLALASVKLLLSRMDAFKADNEKAHAAITENVRENRREILQEIRGMDAKLSTIATDVAYLAGRQAERDRN